MGTHELGAAEAGTSQDMETNQPSKGHSLPGDRRGREKSGHGKKVTEQGVLTSWRPQKEGEVRICMERRQTSKDHSHSRDHRGWNKSGHGNKPTKQGTLTSWRRQRGRSQDMKKKRGEWHSLSRDGRGRDKSGHRNKVTEQGALTSCRPQREGQVRTWV